MRASCLAAALLVLVAGLFALDAAKAGAAPSVTGAKILGETPPLGYREVGAVLELSEVTDLDQTVISPGAFTTVLAGPFTDRPVSRVYVNDAAVTRTSGANRPGKWIVIEFTTPFVPSPAVQSGLGSRTINVVQNEPISGNGVTLTPFAGAISPYRVEVSAFNSVGTGEAVVIGPFFRPDDIPPTRRSGSRRRSRRR